MSALSGGSVEISAESCVEGAGYIALERWGGRCVSGRYLIILDYVLVLADGYELRGRCLREYLVTSDRERSLGIAYPTQR